MKNRVFRIAAVLFVLALITSCFVGGTFAKYVTSGEMSATARVAKFGVTVTASSDPVFLKNYETDDTTATFTGDYSVSATDNVVAPGTKGKLAAFALSGTPEVAVRVSYEVNNLTLNNWKVGDETYFPIVFVIGSDEYTIDGTTITDAASLKDALNEALEDYCEEYAPGTDLSAIESEDLPTVSWKWPFYLDDDTDVKDTALGNANTPATIKIALTASVTQID